MGFSRSLAGVLFARSLGAPPLFSFSCARAVRSPARARLRSGFLLWQRRRRALDYRRDHRLVEPSHCVPHLRPLLAPGCHHRVRRPASAAPPGLLLMVNADRFSAGPSRTPQRSTPSSLTLRCLGHTPTSCPRSLPRPSPRPAPSSGCSSSGRCVAFYNLLKAKWMLTRACASPESPKQAEAPPGLHRLLRELPRWERGETTPGGGHQVPALHPRRPCPLPERGRAVVYVRNTQLRARGW